MDETLPILATKESQVISQPEDCRNRTAWRNVLTPSEVTSFLAQLYCPKYQLVLAV
jgi:hypothetical protein